MHTPRVLYGLVMALFFFLGVGLFGVQSAQAAQADRVKGWAWSDNVGWISMNCTNTNSCDTVDYGVAVNGEGGTQSMSGYAWSENIGWINFDNAYMVAADRSFHGDAVVYSTIEEPYCESTDPYQTNSSNQVGATGGSYTCTDDSDTDGWDGYVSLSDTSPVAYGPVADGTDDTADGWDWDDGQYYLMDGYAWGGDVVGWIKFSCQDSDGAGPDSNTCGTAGYGVYLDPFYFEFTADKGTTQATAVEYNGSYTHIWTLVPDGDITSCTAGEGPGTWTDTPNKSTSPSPLSELVTGVSQSFPGATSTLSCTSNEGKTIDRTLFIHILPPPPLINFSTTDDNIGMGAQTTLIWTTQNADTCTASAGDSGWGGSIATGTNQTYTTEPLTASSTTYNMSCTSIYPEYYPDGAFASLDIHVQELRMDFYAEDRNGDRIVSGELLAYTEKDEIDLVWETEFATGGCVASGDWSGTKVAASSTNDIVDGREATDMPEGGTYNYSLTCSGEWGSEITRSVRIRITNNPEFSEEISNQLQ